MFWLLALPALVIVNAVTFALFAVDKRRVIAGEWRVAESTLLGWAALGGSPGALWACSHLRHKTRKQPFATRLAVIATVQAGVVAGLAIACLP